MAEQIKGDQEVTTATLAEFCQVTPRYCNQLADQGYMMRSSKGKFMFLASLRGYIKNLQAKARARGNGPGEEAEDLVRERVRLTYHNANIAQLDERQKAGELVNVNDVAEIWTGRMLACRSRLLSLPHKLAAASMAADSLQDAADVATRLIHEALHELSSETEEYSTRLAAAPASTAKTSPKPKTATKTDAEPVGRAAKSAQPRSQRRTRQVAQRKSTPPDGGDG